MSLQIKVFTFNPIQENTYIVFDQFKNCVIIDPGCYDRSEQQELLAFIQDNQLVPKALLNTHGHIDHVLGNAFIQRHFKLNHYIHEEDLVTLNAVPNYAHIYGFPAYEAAETPNKILQGGEMVKFGEIEFQVLFTPGHAPGHVVYYNAENKFVINGDVLFRDSFGRYDLPGGNLETLKKTIKNVMFSLPEDTTVFCGHGPTTTIGNEKRSNPILTY